MCNVIVKGRSIRYIAGKRIKYYSFRPKANPGFQQKNGQVLHPLRKSRKRSDRIDDPGGKGWEIGKEVFLCEKCSQKVAEEIEA